MRPRLLAAAFFAALAMATSAQTLPAPASPAETAARTALRDFFHAMNAGDDQAALALITFSKPENQKICEAMFKESCAGKRLLVAATARFGRDQAQELGIPLDDDAVAIEKNMDKAKVIVKGDTAEITTEPTLPPVVLALKDGKWKIDFEKSQANMGPLPKMEIADSLKTAAAYDQITADLKAKKLTTIQDVAGAIHKSQPVTTVGPTNTN